MLKAFTQHPQTVGESYFEHLGSAWGFASSMAVGAIACLLHGLFPFAFQSAGSRRIRDLHDRMVTHRPRSAFSTRSEASNESAIPYGITGAPKTVRTSAR